MVLHKLERRNYSGKWPVNIKYQNLHTFKEGLILLCQSILETRKITHLHGSAHFTIPLNILKLPHKVFLENCILTCKYFNQSLPKSFKNWFTLATGSHTHNIRWSNSGCLKIPSPKTKIYDRHSVNISVIYICSYLEKLHVSTLFYQLTKLKSLINNSILLIITSSLMSYIVH